MNYKKALQELEKGLEELKETNRTIPIAVEGEKDVGALHNLGITGDIFTVHSGKSILELCDSIAARHKAIIILTDWDKKGGRLCRGIRDNLQGRTKCITDFRELFAKNTMVTTIEGLPSYLETLRKRVQHLPDL
jgi:5S rRNA maturation endonuclease (ribonuclease M5)